MLDSPDERYIEAAIQEARHALSDNEVPIGAVVVRAGQIVGRGYNRQEGLTDPTAHAEIIAITAAANHLQDWRLGGCTLYVTKEPCPMCAGALVNARLDRLVFGTWDEQAGCAGSLYQLCRDPRFNHQLEVVGGILEDQCLLLLQEFFRRLRDKNGE